MWGVLYWPIDECIYIKIEIGNSAREEEIDVGWRSLVPLFVRRCILFYLASHVVGLGWARRGVYNARRVFSLLLNQLIPLREGLRNIVHERSIQSSPQKNIDTRYAIVRMFCSRSARPGPYGGIRVRLFHNGANWRLFSSLPTSPLRPVSVSMLQCIVGAQPANSTPDWCGHSEKKSLIGTDPTTPPPSTTPTHPQCYNQTNTHSFKKCSLIVYTHSMA